MEIYKINYMYIKKCFILLLLFTYVFTQWSDDPGNPKLLGSGIQPQIKITSDGGVYFVWLTNGNYHVYIQRLNQEGIAQFNPGGILVSDNNNASWIAVYHLNLTVDSEDNAIITFVDQRSGTWEVYAYKIAPDGTMLWGVNGLTLSDSGSESISPRLTVFPDNSIVVTWSENYNSIIAQSISSNGDLLWGDGIIINSLSASLLSPFPIISSDGHLLIQWISQTGPFWAPDSKLYIQKYDINGNSIWTNQTLIVGPVIFPMGNWLQESEPDALNGSFSAWTEMSGNVQSAIIQNITEEGELLWDEGIQLSSNFSQFRMSPKIAVANNSQELMAVWNVSNGSQSQRGVYAQRVNENGNRLWGINGLSVVPLNNNYDYLDLSIVEVDEELITVYIEQSVNMSGDIHAVRLDINGNSVWTNDYVEITNSNTPKSDMMIEKGLGCVFVTWSENNTVYAHCLKDDGTLGTPEVSELGDINSDGNIDILDVVMLVNYILSSDTSELEGADINSDDNINILDVVTLVGIILG